ncbi:acetylxylan esterase [Paenibacillus mucilaginosus]|uniref:Esterase n=3 Tax=Paenibacillus mucilaginosus TaxID=61624 RepID=H6NKZ5_9BACL|nr:alpha/beta fold hydrolase [Paenibacillus mucilaginosus]AFC29301.1 esterase [Paenibacillus mucilaginosus 3016]AFH61480.1 acetyl esterase [Paenibacillus mucilaginosus K02]MCG7211826.1 acetylxylan esterase [Paenibacillus mucilaginosus]WDM29825.1 alpha/beta fold hydrolase [Paenibacillus mucilaginosus]WFA22557.1 alpha/beta fold hydrolase [Paenibacillus mucilaginosus]
MPADMPLTELLQYGGSSPKPDDFDAYWERGLKELEEQSLDYELVPADFKSPLADCFHLYFTGVGGARVHCKLARPKRAEGKGPGLAYFHGYSCDSGDWFEKIGYAAHGFTVLAMDCRGQGGPSQDNLSVQGTTIRGHLIRGIDDPDPDKLYFRSVFLDTVQTVRILMAMDGVDPQRVGVYGLSQGGALTTACAALEPRVRIAVPVYPFLSDYKRAWQSDVSVTAYEELLYYFRFFDPHHAREEEVFRRLGYIDIQNLADRIQARVLWVTALTDKICPPSTQFAAYNKIRSEKELLVYHEFGHENLPYLADRAFQEFMKL